MNRTAPLQSSQVEAHTPGPQKVLGGRMFEEVIKLKWSLQDRPGSVFLMRRD